MSNWVGGADIQGPGLGVFSSSYEILKALCIHNKLPSRPDTYFSPHRCLLIDSLLSSLSRTVHISLGSGDIYLFFGEVSIVPWLKLQVRTVMENIPKFPWANSTKPSP